MDKKCAGSLRALDPATGHFIWEYCMSGGPVLGSVSASPGLVMAASGRYLVVLDSATGHLLYGYTDKRRDALFHGSPSIAGGRIYLGSMDGNLYSFGI